MAEPERTVEPKAGAAVSEIVHIESALLLPTDTPSAAYMLHAALSAGRPAQELTEMYALVKEERAWQAEQVFNVAFAKFQAECPAIARSRTADIVTSKGSKFSYSFASLDEIDKVAIPVMNKHGLTRTFGAAVISDGVLTIACIISHVGGHSRETPFSVPIETQAGMSPQQKYGSASTYAKRQAFVNAAGLKVCDMDDDGAGRNSVGPATKITEEQVILLQEHLEYIDATTQQVAMFVKSFAGERLGDMSAARYDEAVKFLKAKKP